MSSTQYQSVDDGLRSSLSSWSSSLSSTPFDAAVETLTQIHGIESLVRMYELDLIAHLVSCDEWKREGARSVGDWLSIRLGMSRHEAAERARIALALPGLPLIRAAFVGGTLDWARLSLVTQIADDADDDALFAAEAASMSLGQLKAIVVRKKATDAGRVNDAHERRYLRFRHDDANQSTRLDGLVTQEFGIAIEKMINAVVDAGTKDVETGLYPDHDKAAADALCELLLGDTKPHVEILVDVDLAAFGSDQEGSADLEGHAISRETLRRLACDASVRPAFLNDEGQPLGVGTGGTIVSALVIPSRSSTRQRVSLSWLWTTSVGS